MLGERTHSNARSVCQPHSFYSALSKANHPTLISECTHESLSNLSCGSKWGPNCLLQPLLSRRPRPFRPLILTIETSNRLEYDSKDFGCPEIFFRLNALFSRMQLMSPNEHDSPLACVLSIFNAQSVG